MKLNGSRRKFLGGILAFSAASIAGCSAFSSTASDDETASCSMYDIDADRVPPLRTARVSLEDGNALLRVELNESEIRETNATVVNAYNPQAESRTPLYTIPIHEGDAGPADRTDDDGVVTKFTYIDPLPVSGQLRVEVQSVNGDVLAYRQFDFECR